MDETLLTSSHTPDLPASTTNLPYPLPPSHPLTLPLVPPYPAYSPTLLPSFLLNSSPPPSHPIITTPHTTHPHRSPAAHPPSTQTLTRPLAYPLLATDNVCPLKHRIYPTTVSLPHPPYSTCAGVYTCTCCMSCHVHASTPTHSNHLGSTELPSPQE